MKLHGRVWDEPVCAVAGFTTAGELDEAKERGNNEDQTKEKKIPPKNIKKYNNEDLAVAADSKDPLQIGDCRRHGNLVSYNKLAHHVVFFVFQFVSVVPYR